MAMIFDVGMNVEQMADKTSVAMLARMRPRKLFAKASLLSSLRIP